MHGKRARRRTTPAHPKGRKDIPVRLNTCESEYIRLLGLTLKRKIGRMKRRGYTLQTVMQIIDLMMSERGEKPLDKEIMSLVEFAYNKV